MAKVSDNQFPKVILTEQGSTPANPSAGDQKIFIRTSDHKLCRVNSAGGVTVVEGGTGDVVGPGSATDGHLAVFDGATGKLLKDGGAAASGGLLAVKSYAPASLATYSITSTSMADVDATNLSVTFTAPASGKVLVRLGAFCDETAAAEAYWGLRESTTDLSGSIGRIIRALADQGYMSYTIYLTGISAGSHTYKWSAGVSAGGTHRILVQDGSAIAKWAPALMEVWAAP